MVTPNVAFINPPHSLVRVYQKKISKNNFSLYLDYTVRGVRHQSCMRLYLMNEKDIYGKFNKSARLFNVKVLKKAMEIRMKKEEEILENEVVIEENGKRILLSSYLDSYIEESKICRKGNSYVKGLLSLQSHLYRFLDKKIKSLTLDEVTPSFCRKFINYFRSVLKVNGKQLSHTSASLYLDFFRALLDNAVKDDLIVFNPFMKLKKHEFIRRDESLRVSLTEYELEKLAHTKCSNENVSDAFFFACYTGLRISDITALKWGNLHLSLKESYMEILMCKTGKPLSMKLSRKALCHLPNISESVNGHVFKLPGRNSLSLIIHKWAKQAKIQKKVTFHTSRHTFGTLLAERGVNMQIIQKLMGHRSICSTSVYVDISDRLKKEAIDLL